MQLYAAGTNGYGSAATPLLSTPVTTDASGGFTINSGFTCPTPSTVIYLVVSGGNPGLPLLADNRALVLMEILGTCGDLSASNFVVVNELTTVASAYAFAPFALDYAHIGTSSTNLQGMRNAVATASNLVQPSTGLAPGSAPPIASIPVTTINTLGDVLASCVNTSGSTASNAPCGILFNAATPLGSSPPGDTFTAALNVARNPGLNTASIFSIVGSTPPFQPTLTSAPPDWTLSINWTSPALSTPTDIAIDSQGGVWVLSTPAGSTSSFLNVLHSSGLTATFPQTGTLLSNLALDAFDDPWLSNSSSSSILELTSAGSAASSNPFTGGGIIHPGPLAFDSNGNLWIADSTPTVSELGPTGVANSSSSGFLTTGSGTPAALALDTSGNLWVADSNSNNIYVLDRNGNAIPGSPYSGGLSGPSAVAIDTTGGAWIANRTGSSLARLSSSGQPVSGSPYTGAGLDAPAAIALDGVDNVWLVNSGNNSLSEFLSSGRPQSSSAGYGSAALLAPARVAIDRSGNVWVANSGTSIPGSGIVTEIVGAAAPIITPAALAIQNNVLDQRP